MLAELYFMDLVNLSFLDLIVFFDLPKPLADAAAELLGSLLLILFGWLFADTFGGEDEKEPKDKKLWVAVPAAMASLSRRKGAFRGFSGVLRRPKI